MFCKQYKPDMVIEMNRSRCDVQGLPNDIIHVCWLVDLWEKTLDQYVGSEMIFFFDPTWKKLYPYTDKCFCDCLPPGTSRKQKGTVNNDFLHDFSFAGHIPKPWSENELERVISYEGGPEMKFGTLYNAVVKEANSISTGMWPEKATARMKRLIRRGCKIPKTKYYDENMGRRIRVRNLHGAIYYDVNTRMSRMWGRQRLIDEAVKISDSVGIYGSENWADWECYRRFYSGMVESPEDLVNVYRGSRINLHQGVGMHFRVIDCMAVGGTIFVMRRGLKNVQGEIGDYFEDGVQFVSFGHDDFAGKAEDILADEDKRRRIGEEARKAVEAAHTWRHRAEKILHHYRTL